MKILDRYIARQLLGVTALGVMALSALLLLGNLFKELRPLLVENKAPISIVLEFIFQVIPFSLMFSIPWGFLTAVLLVYGRLASDNELTSMRMSGMSLWRLSAPAIAIGIALSGGDYTRDLQTSISKTGVELMGARQQMVIAARATGRMCFDTVYTDLDDMEGFRKDVEMIKTMGFDGKSIINPRQIPIVHEIFTPTQKDIIFAEKVVKEIDSKKALGIGVFTVDGKMIDIAFYDGAKRTIDLAKASGVYKGDL